MVTSVFYPKQLSSEEEEALIIRCQSGDAEARNILIEHNLRLVAHIAKKYSSTGYPTDDLISIGSIGLIKAVSTYDPDKGTKLGTYAVRCIANEILMLLRSSRKYSREVSLFEPIGVDKDGETVSLVDVIEMENKEVLDSIIFSQDVRELYEAYENCLKDNEKQVLSMRYGLFGKKEETQREIAKKLGISRSYVSRIEKKAIEKIRAEFEKSSR